MVIKAGRDFTIADGPTAPGVAIINESLARRYWPHSNPIGQSIQLDFGSALTPWDAQPRKGWITIVGVVGDVHEWQWDEATFGQVYLPVAQNPSRMMGFVVRSSGDPKEITAAMKGVIASIDPDQPITAVRSMDEYLSDALAQRRLSILLLGLFAGVATLLAGIGIYGVMAYAVSQRSHEIGIRMALGAEPSHVLRMVVADGMRLAAAGLVIGLGCSFFVLRYLKSQLYGIRASDPLTLGCVVAGLALIAAAACYFPARRATKVDPLVALRYE
jgi:putative ABC transport system permease protein